LADHEVDMTTSSSSGGAQAPSLRRSDLSALYHNASDVSAAGQKSTKRLVQAELWTLVLAAAAAVTRVPVGSARIDVLAIVSGVMFALSLICHAERRRRKPEEAWYGGRAAAESVKTLAWRYAVGGDPFPTTSTDRDAAGAYLERLKKILDELKGVGLASTPPDGSDLTPAMKALRAASFDDRRAAYEHDRIGSQITWYSTRGDEHEKRARWWTRVTVLSSAAGLAAALVRTFGGIEFDLLGVFAACASAAIAWNQLNQNRVLVAAYRVTASELTNVRGLLEFTDEVDWPTFVSDAEDAISREHTLWLARHGHPSLGRG